MDADWSFWKKMFKEKPILKAYFHKGESEFEHLDMLFNGCPESPMTGSQQVITVSSDDDSSIRRRYTTPTVVVISNSTTGEEVESLMSFFGLMPKKSILVCLVISHQF